MFPLSDSARAARFPFITWLLIVANIYVFFREVTAPNLDAFIMQYALVPIQVNWLDFNTLIPFITAQFLHAGFLHILSNMWFLFIFGDNVEGALSPVGFLLLFLVAGIAGNLIQYLFTPGSDIPMLGASGAVAGILGCYFVLFPHSKIKTLVVLVFFITILEVSAPLMLGYWFILQLFSGASSFGEMASSQGGVAYFAHIAGFIVGMIVGKIVKTNKPRQLYE